MTRAEKLLYHQIHPLKLGADISSCVVSCAILWQGRILLAMVVAWIPAFAATFFVTAFVRLDRQRASAFGRYVSTAMTPAVMAQRFAGQIVMWIGAYRHSPALLALGAVVIVLAWLSRVGNALPQNAPT